MFKKENGITLVALVITIIVLLILAAVSIATLSGENGLFRRAIEARNTSANASYNENAALQTYINYTNQYWPQ